MKVILEDVGNEIHLNTFQKATMGSYTSGMASGSDFLLYMNGHCIMIIILFHCFMLLSLGCLGIEKQYVFFSVHIFML